MVVEKVKGVFITILISLWTLWFVFCYDGIGIEYKKLIEYINIFLFGFVWFLYNKNTLTLILICLLAWNVAEESGVLLGNDFIKYSAFLIPVFYFRAYLESFFSKFILYLLNTKKLKR